MPSIKLNKRGALQLATMICEVDPNTDEETLQNLLILSFGVTLSQFTRLAEKIIPYSIPANSPLVQAINYGFDRAAALAPEEVPE